jgi:hypothetical protein
MSMRQPLPLWLAAAALLVSLATGQLACRLLHPADPAPQTIAELRQFLARSDLDLHVVQNTDITEEAGIYLCTTPQSREQLWRLLRLAQWAPHWKGVVFCSAEGSSARIPGAVVEGWGENGMRLGKLLFFGDPDLLARIRKALVQGRRIHPAPESA